MLELYVFYAYPWGFSVLVVYTSCIQEMWFKKGDETLKYMTDKAFKKEINKCGLCRSSHILALMDER